MALREKSRTEQGKIEPEVDSDKQAAPLQSWAYTIELKIHQLYNADMYQEGGK